MSSKLLDAVMNLPARLEVSRLGAPELLGSVLASVSQMKCPRMQEHFKANLSAPTGCRDIRNLLRLQPDFPSLRAFQALKRQQSPLYAFPQYPLRLFDQPQSLRCGLCAIC
jgi:hypothetical protein